MGVDTHIWWYVARSSGLVAWMLLTASVLWGVVLTTRLLGKRATPAWLLDLHRFLGGLACAFTATHVAGLVADSYVHLGAAAVLVPLASPWKPVAVASGVLAMYLLVAVEATSLLRRRLPARLWRRVHAASGALWLMATGHTLTAGTDVGHPVVQWVALGSVLAVLFAGMVRLLSPKPDRPAARRASPVAANATSSRR
jgi:hypothetical protein